MSPKIPRTTDHGTAFKAWLIEHAISYPAAVEKLAALGCEISRGGLRNIASGNRAPSAKVADGIFRLTKGRITLRMFMAEDESRRGASAPVESSSIWRAPPVE